MLISLLMTDNSSVVLACEADQCVSCRDMDKQFVNGKWKNYDFVMNNCLVKKFIEESGNEDTDFYRALSSFEKLAELRVERLQQEISNVNKERASGIRGQLEMKANIKKLQQQKQAVLTMIQDARMGVTLLEVEINTLMLKCFYTNRPTQLETCTDETCSLKSRAIDLYTRLRTFHAVLLAGDIKSAIEADF